MVGQPAKVAYNWHLLTERPNDPVEVCEGEADADRMTALGFLATTVAGQNWSETAAEALRGRDVAIWEHNDDAGRENVEEALKYLTPVVARVRVVRLPGLPHRGDVRDWLAMGHTKEDLLEQRALASVWGAPPIDIASLAARDVPVRIWLLQDRIPNRAVSLFSGEGSAGKSLLQLQLSAACALSREWLGLGPLGGPTLFIDAEDDGDELHRRLDAIRRYYNTTYTEMSKALHILNLTDADAVMAAPKKSFGPIEPTAQYRRVLEMAGDLKPVIMPIERTRYAGASLLN
jgi:hypothetical protein